MTSIYLGNLSWGLDDEALGQAIGEIAVPISLEIKRNKYGKSLGYALASFEDEETATAVIAALHGMELDGREVNCREDRGARPKPAPAATNRVFIGNLSWETPDDVLMKIFAEYNIVSAEVQLQNSGQSKGWALAEFGSAEDAQAAIQAMNGAELDGREIICREDRGTPGGRKSGGGRGQPRQRQPREPRQPRERRIMAAGAPSTSVFVGNLSWDMNDDGLDELLRDFDVEGASVQTRPDGKSRGYALVQFTSIEEAQRAIDELNGQDVMDRPLLLKFDAK